VTGVLSNRVGYQGRDFDGLAVDNNGYLVSVDGINYSGLTRQIAFHRLTLYPASATFLGDYLLSDPGVSDLEITPTDSWVLHSARHELYRAHVDNPGDTVEIILMSPISENFGGLTFAPDFETDTATVTIVVTDPDAPVASDDVYDVPHNTVLTVPVADGLLDNDTDPQGDPIEAVLRSGPAHGTLALATDGSFVYTPDTGFAGIDTFVYQADDGMHGSNFATVTVDVTNVAAVAVDDESFTVDEDVTLSVAAADGVLANDDSPDGDPLTAVVVDDVTHGTLGLEPDGSDDSAEATVSIDVTLANSIAGTVGNDLDGNGTVDPGEPPLEGWNVFLDENNDGLLDPGEVSTTTDADGNYRFLELAPGDYTVALQLPAGWLQTPPAEGGDGTLTFLHEDAGGNDRRNLAISPDGRTLYAVSKNDNLLRVFSRDPVSGSLTWLQGFDNVFDGWNVLDMPLAVTLSPDGAHVYVTGHLSDTLSIFARDSATGLLTFVAGLFDGQDGTDGLDGVMGVEVSPDGRHAYVVAHAENSLASFARDPVSGELTFSQVIKEGVGGEFGLEGARYVAVSPDGAFAYTVASGSDALSVFSRNETTGELTYVTHFSQDDLGIQGA